LNRKKKATTTKSAPKKDAETKPGPAKKLTPEERRRLHEQEEAEKARAVNEQKLEAALVSQHEEESRAEGFVYSPHKSTGVVNNSNKLSRTEWEAKKAKGEPLADQKENASQQVQQPVQVVVQPQQGKGNRNFDNDNHPTQRRQQHQDKNEHHGSGRGPKPGREHDRHSQATTGRKPETKRGGGGKYNVGSATEDLSAENTGSWGADNVNKDDAPTTTTWVGTNESENAGDKKDAEEKKTETATPEEAKPVVQDPDDEGFGKKNFSRI